MSVQLNDLWEKTLNLLKSELTEISYNTWIRTLEPVSMGNNSITLKVPADFQKGLIESRYLYLIRNTLSHVTNKDYAVSLVVPSGDAGSAPASLFSSQTGDDSFSSVLNPKYTFDTFVVGNSNRFAHAASLAVAEAPAKAYNPLFIYGGVGLGKTHLMHAIGHYIFKQNPSQKILYVTSEKFTNELINAIKDDRNEAFRTKYRNIDVLLIDDIQFIGGKERTQEEFFHTFNTLYEADKQIIISSDKPPRDMITLEERLRSRFEWGLIADIQTPDFETRLAILRKKAQLEKLIVPDEIMTYIADKIVSNIRELEGALNKVVAFASLTENSNITVDLAREALKDMLSHSSRVMSPAIIQNTVAKYFNIRADDLKSTRRSRDVSFPRQIAMYLCRELMGMSLPKIGEEFGGRDHTTVIHAFEKISNECKRNPEVQKMVEEIKRTLTGK